MYNPAGVARVKGLSASYAQRQYNWISWMDERRYQSVTVTVKTPIVTLGAMYERDYYGDFNATTAYSPDGTGTGKAYDHLLGLGAGISLGEHWDIGLAGKMFDRVVSNSGGSDFSLETTPAFMVDAGVIYRLYREAAENHYDETFTAGLSVQNIGTELTGRFSVRTLAMISTVATTMPRYLRVGVAYALTKQPAEGTGLVPFQLLLTGGARYLMNWAALGMTRNRVGVGFGADGLIYELLSLRLGVQKIPDNSVYVPATNDWTLRFGAGLSFPFRLVGLDTPLILQGEYAAIAVDDYLMFTDYIGPRPTTKSLLHDFSISLRYEADLIH